VLRRELAPGPGGHADDERDAELATRHVAQSGGVVEDLVEGEEAEVPGHDLHDRAHAGDGGADAGADEGRFRQRGVAHPIGPELLEQALGDGEAAAVAAHVLTHEEHSVVAGECLAQGGPHGVPARRGGHQPVTSA
jgi:hypothetical protein